ncbi:fibronectin type III domain-containing protein [Halobacillus sp. A5]|uniref:fibronectin type III domain-containing protein n=1 Tax=Halobacillus sp. A5 TaxID=2880263 RepID=UPI0020A668AD|nr:fibronectin type III domain-containing protein [Halobacillus sp. A5]MCP3029183.1 fibronectin type III domain-containing protein [Halobacillus sp. A5]
MRILNSVTGWLNKAKTDKESLDKNGSITNNNFKITEEELNSTVCNDISTLDWVEGSELVEIEDTQPPNEVENIYVTNVLQESLTLHWSASNSSDIKEYNIYLQENLLGTTSSLSFQVTSLSADTEYTFFIKAVDQDNNESIGVSFTVRTASLEFYLQMSGTDSFFRAPSSLPLYNKIVVIGLISVKDNGDLFYSGSGSYSVMSGAKRNIEKIEINGDEIPGNLGNYVPIGEDCEIIHYLSTPKSGSLTLFGSNSSNSMPGNIYNIEVFHDDVLIAEYDTSEGNVLDQSENGHDASINGSHSFVEID